MGILTVTEQVSGSYKPAYNDNIFVVTAPTAVTSNSNVKILADVKDSSGNLLARLKAPIYYGTTNKAVFNISQILCDYVTFDWDFDDTESKDCQNSRYGYQMAFGYEYSTGTTSPIVSTTGDTLISTKTVWNAGLNPFDWLDYQLSDYLMASGSTANFLTNNLNKRIYRTQKEWLYALHGSSIGYLDVSWSATRRNLLYNSVLDGGGSAPTFWNRPTATGTSTPTASTLSDYDTAYVQIGTAERPYLQTTNALSVNANTNYVLSMQLESITGTISYNNVITIVSIPSGASIAYYRNGVLVNENTQALTGRLSVVLTVSSTAGTCLPRIGLGVSGNATGTIVFSQPQFEQATSATTYVPTKLVSAKSGTICRFPIGANIPDGIPSGVDGYTINPISSGGSSVGSVYNILIDDRCSKFESIDLFFLNRLGGVESFRFNLLHRKTHSIERKTFRKNPYTLNVNTYNYSKGSHALTNYHNEDKTSYVLNSNYLTEEEAEWLTELVNSPLVWLYDGEIKAVTIKNTEYEERLHVNDKVFNLNLEVEVSLYDIRR